jgi:uncharacterized repeat protein (TIGR03803 family)
MLLRRVLHRNCEFSTAADHISDIEHTARHFGGFMLLCRRYARASFVHVLQVMLLGTVLAQGQTFNVVYDFGKRNGDPTLPSGNVAQGRDGALYTTSYSGGLHNSGAVFKITPSQKMRVLYDFCSKANCADGSGPVGGLILRPDGHFLGTTETGGKYGYGTIFDITSVGEIHILYNFRGGLDGSYPAAPPALGRDGAFYGTTWEGGGPAGCGAIYKIRNSGVGHGGFEKLHDFNNVDGCNSTAALTLGPNGNFYGTTNYGGSGGYGVVFEMSPAGKLTLLHEFQGVGDGYSPDGALIVGNDGDLYGTTRGMGTPFGGTVFRISPKDHQFTLLHDFAIPEDGAWLIGGVAQGSDGNFYGAAEQGGDMNCANGYGCGTLFQITPTGSYSVLHDFNNVGGYWASTAPFQHTNGRFYGDTYWGGAATGLCASSGCGVFYSLDVGMPPFVSVVPNQAARGSTVQILGQDFTPSTTVSFNGVPAEATVVSGTYLRAIVPDGARSGVVTVTTSGGILTSKRHFVVAPGYRCRRVDRESRCP